MELITGVTGTRPDLMDEAGIDRREIVETGVRCYLRQIFEVGSFHADPHEGNLFAMPDGRVGFIDFGRVGWASERSSQERSLTPWLKCSSPSRPSPPCGG